MSSTENAINPNRGVVIGLGLNSSEYQSLSGTFGLSTTDSFVTAATLPFNQNTSSSTKDLLNTEESVQNRSPAGIFVSSSTNIRLLSYEKVFT